MRRCVWSRNTKNEEARARVGPQRHGGGEKELSNLSIGSIEVCKFFSGTLAVSIQKFSSVPPVTTSTDNYNITLTTSQAGW